MSIETSLANIKEYKDLFEKEKENMSEIEKAMLSPNFLNIAGDILELFNKKRNE